MLFLSCARSLLLCRLFSSCSDWGLLSRCGAWASHCCLWLPLLWSIWSSVVVTHRLSSCRSPTWDPPGFSSYGSEALQRTLRICGARAQLLCDIWSLPRPGIEPVSPALAGAFLSTEPPGKSSLEFSDQHQWGLLSPLSPSRGRGSNLHDNGPCPACFPPSEG